MTPLSHITSALLALKAYDDRRPGVPGEHWAALAAALATLNAGRQQRSTLGRAALFALGGLLLVRSISGRDGALARVRRAAAERAS